MGAFCGKFKDDHQSTDQSDLTDVEDGEEDVNRAAAKQKPSMLPKDHLKAKKQQKEGKKIKMPKQQQLQLGGGGKVQWAPYLSPIMVEVSTKDGSATLEYLRIRAVKAKQLSPSMLESISQINKIHTLELVKCKLTDLPPNLQELDSLSVVRLSHNELTSINPELAKCTHLERIIFDWNTLKTIDPGIFSQAFKQLLVINVSHNELKLLPSDFGLGLDELRYIDASYNSLAILPDSVLTCNQLQVLILSHNKMQRLPAQIGHLTDLRKLFVSFNLLHELPESIGDCRRLEKLRVVSNYIRNMPLTIINLWQDMGGCLEEFLVDRNPLVHPSITAFEMGGLQQAMKLFKEYKDDLEANPKMLDSDLSDAGSRAGSKAAAPLPPPQSSSLSLPLGDSGVSMLEKSGAVRSGDSGQGEEEQLEEEALDGEVTMKNSARRPPDFGDNEFYFAHCREKDGSVNQALISDIRSAETSLLLLKKNHFVEDQKKLAHAKEAEAKKHGGSVPKQLQIFLEDGFDVTKFHSVVRVTDLDLYFNLLVFSTKPMLTTCHLLFDKYQTAPNHETEDGQMYMDRQEWSSLCSRVPVKLPEQIQTQMWQLLAWRDGERLEERDFIAGWHIHDVEKRDNQIKRVAKGLKLDYYDMDVEEMQVRLSAKGAEDADPTLDFDDSESEDEEMVMNEFGEMVKQEKAEKPAAMLTLEIQEGERRLGKKIHHKEDAAPAASTSAAVDGKVQISLTDQEYSAIQAQIAEGSEGGDSERELSFGSSQLSEETAESESSFDATEFVREGEDEEEEGGDFGGSAGMGDSPRKKEGKKKMVIDSDIAIRKLMTLAPDDILEQEKVSRRGPRQTSADDKEADKLKKKKKKAKPKTGVNDTRFKTDVWNVRQTLRQVYRNIPHDDFVKLTNFLLRGMRYMKHSPPDRPSYWHADEPTFKHTMGQGATNPYTRLLLVQMGFVCVNDLYWAWPALHLKGKKETSGKRIETWGDKIVPPHCPGKHKDRMEDMILLFRCCQRALNQKGEKFTGHFN